MFVLEIRKTCDNLLSEFMCGMSEIDMGCLLTILAFEVIKGNCKGMECRHEGDIY
jgi:hypothetical protein